LYEDQNLLIINKPSNLVVNRATTVKEATVQDWFIEYLGAKYFTDEFWQQNLATYQDLIPSNFNPEFGQPLAIWQERLGIVHRLDKNTSGVLLLAKNPGALVNLLAQFKNRQTQKTYLALVHGKFIEKSGHIVAPMSRSVHNRLKFAVNSEGRVAITDYQVEKEFVNLNEELINFLVQKSRLKIKKVRELYQDGFSLLKLEPKTGRTHQIRVHMSTMQHPIVGDQLYAGKKRIRLDNFWCSRHFLHALSLEFTHPKTSKKMLIEALLADDLKQVLDLVT
jgi:23S rRNA pseudouridine1911/1915/1917 synthase